MKTLYVLASLSVALATPFALAAPDSRTAAPTNRVPVPKAVEEHVGQTPRLYEVGDLTTSFGSESRPPKLGVIEAWHAPEQTKARAVERPQPDSVHEDLLQAKARIELGPRNLVDVLKRHMQPMFVESTERLECKTGTLVAHLMPTQHAWIDSFLRRLRDFNGYVEVETRIVEAAPAVFASLGLEDKSILSRPADLAKLDELIRATGECNLLAAPRLMTLPAQLAGLSTMNEFKFVQDWTIEKVEPGEREIAVPMIAVIREGVALSVRALPLQDDQFAIELSVQTARVKRPVRTVSLAVGSDSKQVEITLPEAESVKFDGTVLLASGASTILRGMSVDKSKSIAVIVTARHIPGGGR